MKYVLSLLFVSFLLVGCLGKQSSEGSSNIPKSNIAQQPGNPSDATLWTGRKLLALLVDPVTVSTSLFNTLMINGEHYSTSDKQYTRFVKTGSKYVTGFTEDNCDNFYEQTNSLVIGVVFRNDLNPNDYIIHRRSGAVESYFIETIDTSGESTNLDAQVYVAGSTLSFYNSAVLISGGVEGIGAGLGGQTGHFFKSENLDFMVVPQAGGFISSEGCSAHLNQ